MKSVNNLVWKTPDLEIKSSNTVMSINCGSSNPPSIIYYNCVIKINCVTL